MYKKIATYSLVFSLVGCTGISPAQMAQMKEKYAQEAKTCSHGEPLNKENAVARRDCMDNYFVQIFQDVDYPYMDLVYNFVAVNKMLANNYSEGRISEEQYKASYIQNASFFIRSDREQDQLKRDRFNNGLNNFLSQQQQIQQLQRPPSNKVICTANPMASGTIPNQVVCQ